MKENYCFNIHREKSQYFLKEERKEKFRFLDQISENLNNSEDLNPVEIIDNFNQFIQWWNIFSRKYKIQNGFELNAQISDQENKKINDFFIKIVKKLKIFSKVDVADQILILNKIKEVVGLNSSFRSLVGFFCIEDEVLKDDEVRKIVRLDDQLNAYAIVSYFEKFKKVSSLKNIKVDEKKYNVDFLDPQSCDYLEKISKKENLRNLMNAIFNFGNTDFFKNAEIDFQLKKSDWQELYQDPDFWNIFFSSLRNNETQTAYLQSLLLKNIKNEEKYLEKAQSFFQSGDFNEKLLFQHSDWWLCSDTEINFIKASRKNSLMEVNENFIAKFYGKITLLCTKSFMSKNKDFFIAGNYYAPLEHDQEKLTKDFFDNEKKVEINDLSLVLMRAVNINNLKNKIRSNHEFVVLASSLLDYKSSYFERDKTDFLNIEAY